MKDLELTCGECNVPLRLQPAEFGTPGSCTSCGNEFRILAFPALVRQEESEFGAKVMESSEATCFFHTTKRAAVPCDGCGRFLCALCDISFADGHFCSLCIESGAEKKVAEKLLTRRYLYDSISLLLLLTTIMLWPLSLIAAPTALFLSLRHFRKQGGLVPRSKWRFLVAILLSSAIILGWAALFALLISAFL